MELRPGIRIASYELGAPLGRGGMGTVYRGVDTRLHRPVAIKFVSDEVSDDARRRFQQEAQTASALNHPHILTVFEAGEWNGHHYIATEFIDGGTLNDWARAAAHSWRQVVDMMIGVADALATAHTAGILHRDVKPHNILVTTSGYAKLADFGLAKLTQGRETEATQTAAPQTRQGVLVGTIAYMSPEQAAGHPLDARSDIFSFGVVLYELLSGRRPFIGTTDLEVLHSIRQGTADALSDDVPAVLRMIVDKALEKDPADRYQTMRELVVDLRRTARGANKALTSEAAGRRPRSRRWVPIAMAGALVAGVAIDRLVVTNRAADWRNPLENATFTRLTDFEGLEADAVISPDGNYVAFISDRDGPLDIWLLQLGSGQFLNLTNGKLSSLYNSQVRVLGFTADGSYVTVMTRRENISDIGTSIIPTIGGPIRLFMEGRIDPQWSPDGKRLLFFSVDQNKDPMYVAAADGTGVRELFPVMPGEHNHFMAWAPDGRYVYAARSTRTIDEHDIWRTPADGGQPERITHHNAWVGYPTPLDDETLLYVANDENNAGTWLYAMDLERRQPHRLSAGIEQYVSIATTPYVAGRAQRLVATVSNPVATLWSIPFGDSVAGESAALPFVVPSARVSSPRWGPGYLLYLSSRAVADDLWKVQDGLATRLWSGSDGAVLTAAAISHSGHQIAFAVRREGRAGLYVMTADGANPHPLAPSITVHDTPTWAPDDRALAIAGFDDKGPGLFIASTEEGAPRRIYDKICYLPEWSPDGRYILFGEYVAGAQMRLTAVTPEGQPFALADIRMTRTATRGTSSPYRFQPDGKSIILLEQEFRRPQFWLVDLTTGRRRQLSDLKPGRWTRSFDVSTDGKTILFDRVQENADVVLIELPPR